MAEASVAVSSILERERVEVNTASVECIRHVVVHDALDVHHDVGDTLAHAESLIGRLDAESGHVLLELACVPRGVFGARLLRGSGIRLFIVAQRRGAPLYNLIVYARSS